MLGSSEALTCLSGTKVDCTVGHARSRRRNKSWTGADRQMGRMVHEEWSRLRTPSLRMASCWSTPGVDGSLGFPLSLSATFHCFRAYSAVRFGRTALLQPLYMILRVILDLLNERHEFERPVL